MNLRSILPILCGALACAALTVHDTSDAHAGNKYGIALTKLDASLKSGQLTLSYGMKHTTLMSLRGAKIKPSVELYEVKTGRFMYSFPLNAKAGSLTFPKKVSFARNATYDLKFTGVHKESYVHHVTYKGKKMSHLRFKRSGDVLTFVTPGGHVYVKESKLPATLNKAECAFKSGQLTFSYKVSPKDWKKLKKNKIEPSLQLYEVKTGRFMHSFPMTSQSGSLTFPKDASFARGATYSLKMRGAHKAKHLNREVRFVRQGNLCVLSGLAKSKKR